MIFEAFLKGNFESIIALQIVQAFVGPQQLVDPF